MESEAKNFSGQYPLKGEKIGPAWRRLWLMLDPHRWEDGGDLCARVALAEGIDPKTAANLLRAARKVGVVEVRYRKKKPGNQMHAFYRGVES